MSTIRSERELLEQWALLHAAAEETGTALVVGGRALTQPLREKMSYSAYCDTLHHLAGFAGTLHRADSHDAGA